MSKEGFFFLAVEISGLVMTGYSEKARIKLARLAASEYKRGRESMTVASTGRPLTRAWRAAEQLAADQGLGLHSDSQGFPVLVVPKSYHPVRPEESPVPGQAPRDTPSDQPRVLDGSLSRHAEFVERHGPKSWSALDCLSTDEVDSAVIELIELRAVSADQALKKAARAFSLKCKGMFEEALKIIVNAREGGWDSEAEKWQEAARAMSRKISAAARLGESWDADLAVEGNDVTLSFTGESQGTVEVYEVNEFEDGEEDLAEILETGGTVHQDRMPSFLKAYNSKHLTWGSLHIVLADDNLDDESVRHCCVLAKDREDTFGEQLATLLLELSVDERRELEELL